MPISIPLQLKRTTSANRTSYTPKDGEPIVEKDTKKLFIGNGSTPGGVELFSGGGVYQQSLPPTDTQSIWIDSSAGAGNAWPVSLYIAGNWVSIGTYDDSTQNFTASGSGGGTPASSNIVGSVISFAGNAAPTGFLECNGSAISRATYADLFAIIGTNYGNGNGSSTFNLPDYRGQFLRGFDNGAGNDPNAAARTNRGDGTTGNAVGTKQGANYASHKHSGTGGTIQLTRGSGSAGFTWFLAGGNGYGLTGAVPATINTAFAGGSETRPKNIYVIYCIAY